MRKSEPFHERMARSIEFDTNGGCWLWTGNTNWGGYGRVRTHSGADLASTHRVAYQIANGPIPEGYQIDHLCRVRCCCNPAHLEAVTQRENLRRGNGVSSRNAAKTHCIHGHEYTPENTGRGSRGRRRCRACQSAKDRARRAK